MFIVIRYNNEISLKSDIVRNKFLSRLALNLRAALDSHQISYDLKEHPSRYFLTTDDEKSIEILACVFGISSFSIIEHRSEPTVEAMKETIAHYTELVKEKSFCVRVKRFHVKKVLSPEVERELGGVLYPFAKKVDLKNPEVKISVELRNGGAFFYSSSIKGAGGLPLGVEGNALCLISGGFDSAVAAWLTMKRGVALDFVFFNLAASAHLEATLKVTKALVSRWCYGTNPQFFAFDFTRIASEIVHRVDPRYPQVILKRCMLKVAAKQADKLKHVSALVTGEAIGQVSSQTLQNLAAIDSATPYMVLRPLVGFDKDEIIALSVKIGTALLSSEVKEYCQISRHKPTTKASISRATREDLLLDQQIFEEIANEGQHIDLKSNTTQTMEHLFTDTIVPEATVIDCRSAQMFRDWHYPGAIHIPLEELTSKIDMLDKNRKYILYCPIGTQTAVAAEKLQNLGFDARSFKGGTRALKLYFEKHCF